MLDEPVSKAADPSPPRPNLWLRSTKRLRDLPFGGKRNGHQPTPRSIIKSERVPELPVRPANSDSLQRPRVSGKFFFIGEEKFWVKGVTYGTFPPDQTGANYPPKDVVERDFVAIHAAGFNTLRVYTVPPRWLLDLAAAHSLRLMVGLPWEQHAAFLEEKARARDIIRRVRDCVRQCAGHPAIFCYAVGNEIPASVVRWYGRRRIQNFLGQLCKAVRQEDPHALLTYVNYPTTEYLELPCIDFVAFNIYLESKEKLAAYLARLQNLAGERPLLMAEAGLDSRRNGEETQASVLKWQIETIFAGGCAGAFIFAWTDAWHRGGYEIEDWDFGLTTRDRQPKQALAYVSRAFEQVPFPRNRDWQRISVVVCSYNGAETVGETLTALGRLNYPNYEVIVVNDGSTDATAAIVRQHKVQLIETENKGLSHARNLGMEAASGEIIAYIDDDAYPDPDWLKYLATSFQQSDHIGMGGPNFAPSGDGLIADAVAHAPGGPVHVLLEDELAEHIPGCNMAYRLSSLREIGGFDPRFKIAGDDVDICWRLQERGCTLGYSPSAVVWHHSRSSIRAYWKQQKGYAKAEALLADKWPQKYNRAGHLHWSGRMYGKGVINFFISRPRIYHGTWGSALFQSVYEPASGLFSAIPLMPEWYFLVGWLGILTLLGFAWPPFLLTAPVFVLVVAASLIQAGVAARIQHFGTKRRLGLRVLIFWLHLLQPLARLLGRIRHGIGPWGFTDFLSGPLRLTDTRSIWCEEWQSQEARLAAIEELLIRKQATVIRGGDFDRWDLEIHGGLLGSIRAMGMLEEHGAGKQLSRLRAWPHTSRLGMGLFFILACLAIMGAYQQEWLAAPPLGVGALAIAVFARADCARAMRRWKDAIEELAAITDGSGEPREINGFADQPGEARTYVAHP